MAAIQFECTLCSESKCDQPHMVDVYPVCTQCSKEEIVPLFEKALIREYDYPPRWGSIIIDISNFKDVINSDFIGRYESREEEYKTTIRDRIYCSHEIITPEDGDTDPINVLDVVPTPGMNTQRCNAFLGSKNGSEDMIDRICCSTCCGLVCGTCGAALTDTESHECKLQAENEADAAFDGLTRGIAWQVCPHCDTKVQLAEACNGTYIDR